ncbi:MAG: hypothetical protein O8C67_08125 [Candidatus Methanoperedens sp.]|nr:hypothetical protein [Candidatus Methanoperedens sp.]
MQPSKFHVSNYGLTASPFPDSELSKIRSFKKRQELFNILHSEDACHYERLYLVGFLKYIGYSLEEICAIIDQEASWIDYDAKVTWLHVKSVFRSSGCKDIPFLNSFTDGVLGETAFTKAVSPIKARCTLVFTECKSCPDKIDGLCKWVFR